MKTYIIANDGIVSADIKQRIPAEHCAVAKTVETLDRVDLNDYHVMVYTYHHTLSLADLIRIRRDQHPDATLFLVDVNSRQIAFKGGELIHGIEV